MLTANSIQRDGAKLGVLLAGITSSTRDPVPRCMKKKDRRGWGATAIATSASTPTKAGGGWRTSKRRS